MDDVTVDTPFVRAASVEVRLLDGGRIRLRPLVPSDADQLVAGFESMSERSRYRRFLAAPGRLTAEQVAYLTRVDYVDHFAWAAFDLDRPGEPGVGVARYIRIPDEPEVAEAAVTVVDDEQRRGIGTLLLEALAVVALRNGIRSLRAYVLWDNRVVIDNLEEHGVRCVADSPGLARVDADLDAHAVDLIASPVRRVLRFLPGPPVTAADGADDDRAATEGFAGPQSRLHRMLAAVAAVLGRLEPHHGAEDAGQEPSRGSTSRS